MKIGKFYSWEILSGTEAIKYGDKSVFDHHGTGVPKETLSYWDAEGLKYPDKKDVVLVCEGKEYPAYLTTDQQERVRLFWNMDLSKVFNSHPHEENNYPALLYIKIGENKYEVLLSDTEQSSVFNEGVESEIPTQDQNHTEGKKKLYYVSKYERNAHNRSLAIKYHGCKCMACGFDFEKAYGRVGEGFIEVHHIKPLYSLDEEVEVNPQTDLVCLCSNCHRMVHRYKNKVLTIEELKQMLSTN